MRLVAIMMNAQTEIEEQQRMAEMAEKDSLTGIYNRDGLRARMATIYENLDGQMPIAITMVNFNDFKAVNDRLGRAGTYYSYENMPYEALCVEAENVLRDVMQSGKSGYRVEGKRR